MGVPGGRRESEKIKGQRTKPWETAILEKLTETEITKEREKMGNRRQNSRVWCSGNQERTQYPVLQSQGR